MTEPTKKALYEAKVMLPGGYKYYENVTRFYASSEGMYLLTLVDGREVRVPIQYTIIEELEAKS